MKKEFGKSLGVLIVEDNPVDSKLLNGMLTLSNLGPFNIKSADSLKGAFAILSKNKLDVVLLDLNIDDCSGIDTLCKLHQKYPDIPIVVNTGAYRDDLGLKAITSGAQDYLVKGMYKPYGLIKSLYYAIERKAGEKELENAYHSLKDTQAQLIQAEKMNVVGELASGVAHEVKNPLATILYGVEFLHTTLETDNEKTKLTLDSIKDAANKANSIIKDLLDFASLSNLQMTAESLNRVVEQSLNLTTHQCDKHYIKVVKKFDPDLPKIMIDKNRIEQVIVDLILNALFAMKEHGILTIETSCHKFSRDIVGWIDRRGGSLSEGNQIIIVDIDDTGPGIPEKNLTKIFDPFFTTRRSAGGVGLGLSIARTIMKNHNGYISLANIKNVGARARLIFKV